MTIDLEPIRTAWHGPNRSLVIATGVFLVAGLILWGTVLLQIINGPEVRNSLQYPSPQQIISIKPSYKPGETFMVLASRCNRANHPVRVVARSFWESQDTPGLASISGTNTTAGRDVAPGCTPGAFNHTIPLDLTPGRWRFAGYACDPAQHCEYWYSDTFVVVEG